MAAHPQVERLLDVMARLRRDCPWDAEQTHRSLVTYLIEETAEVVEAIEAADDAHLREELGDLLLQVLFHARLTEERPAGEAFGIDEVAAGLVDKLVSRHPHVFADVQVADVEAQTEKAMSNIAMLLDEAGSSLRDIVKVTVYLTDIRYREPVYRVMGKWLKGVFPVSTGLVVDALARPEWLVEIDATAVLDTPAQQEAPK